MKALAIVSALSLASGCAGIAAADFLPSEGRYLIKTNDGPTRTLSVVGSGGRRVLTVEALGDRPKRVLTWEAQDAGVVEVETGVVLLGSPIRVGTQWTVAGKEGMSCRVERRILSVFAGRAQVEEVGVCRGRRVPDNEISTWVIGHGSVHEDFSNGHWRTTTKVMQDEVTAAGLR